ncbi:MAG: CoA transferase, partial [Alphaproteobacteria bacterium]
MPLSNFEIDQTTFRFMQSKEQSMTNSDAKTEDSAPEDAAMPLSGIKVIDIANFLAGPMSSMFLGDFGADVIKV